MLLVRCPGGGSGVCRSFGGATGIDKMSLWRAENKLGHFKSNDLSRNSYENKKPLWNTRERIRNFYKNRSGNPA
jgi:hypothetical protein